MKQVGIQVNIPEEILLSLREEKEVFAEDLKKLASVKLYESGKLSLGQAATLAGMPKEDYIRFLGKNKISIFRFDSDDELIEDIRNA